MSSSAGSQSMSAKPKNVSSGSKLNPFAREWHPARDRAPEEERALFVTFAPGLPVSESEIFQFFQQRFGPCIEKIFYPRRVEDNGAKYMKVIFSYLYIPFAVVGNQDEVKLMVNDKPVWCKRFRPMKKIQN